MKQLVVVAMALFGLVLTMVIPSSPALGGIVIMDQIGPDSTFTDGQISYASQDFEPAYDEYDIGALDDFQVDSATLNLTQLEAVVGGWGVITNWDLVTGWRVEIYDSVAAAGTSLTGNMASDLFTPVEVSLASFGTDILGGETFLATVPLDITLPGAGQYWVSLIPQNDFELNGQTGIIESAFTGIPSNLNAHQANPNLGFGAGPSWPISHPDLGIPVDLAYRLEAIPEASTYLLFGLGTVGLLVWRRRKAR